MDTSPDPMRSVQDALDDLRETTHFRNWCENTGLRADPLEFHQSWAQLTSALRESAHVITNPQPGQGLASIWLRAIYDNAVKCEDAANRYENGWYGVLSNDKSRLLWLLEKGWEFGHRIGDFGVRQDRGLASLLHPAPSPLERIRRLAMVGDTGDQNATVDAGQVGQLILQAINSLEVAKKWISNETFYTCVLNNLDTLPGVMYSLLREVPSKDLVELVAQLKSDNDTTDSPASDEMSSSATCDIDELEKTTPKLDRHNGQWVSNIRAADLDGLEVSTLGKYRQLGQFTTDKMFGQDPSGRIWRRNGTLRSHPWYLRSTLQCSS